MADDTRNTGAPDRDLVALGQEHEVRYWTERFGVGEARLQDAVAAVGHSADAVGRWLRSTASSR